MMDAWEFFRFMKQYDTFARVLLYAPKSFQDWFYDWLDAGAPALDGRSLWSRLLWARRPLLPCEKPRKACGARCKKTGQPCSLTLVYRNGRCRMHGGWSCGPHRRHNRRRGKYHGHSKSVKVVLSLAARTQNLIKSTL